MNLSARACTQCGNKAPIVNSKYGLCNSCNRQRLGSSTKTYSFKKSTPNQVSKKQSFANRKMKAVKDNISKQALDEDDYYCKGCGCGGVHLDRSHSVSIKHNKSLEHDPNNITLLCRSCHDKWESGNYIKMSSLLCFQQIMDYLYNSDKMAYWKIKNKEQ